MNLLEDDNSMLLNHDSDLEFLYATSCSIFADLDAVVSDDGENFSLGQRQLICLARALIKQSSVIIVDEATSSMDKETEALLEVALYGGQTGRKPTIIAIAHRLSTVIGCDRVLVLHCGEAVEYANPYDLLQKPDSAFKEMCTETGELELLEKMAHKVHKDL